MVEKEKDNQRLVEIKVAVECVSNFIKSWNKHGSGKEEKTIRNGQQTRPVLETNQMTNKENQT